MVYTLVPVEGQEDMLRAYEENAQEICFVLGILKLASQVRILHTPDADDDIPEYHEIYKDDTSDEEEVEEGTDDEGESRQAKRRRLNEEDLIKRRERRQWEENKEAIIFNYTQYSYYRKSSAIMMFEMAWKMSKDSLDMVWWAIIGATEQSILNKFETRVSVLEAGSLHGHVSRQNHRQGVDAEEKQQSAVKVTYEI